jgi:P-type Cu2+ transporter
MEPVQCFHCDTRVDDYSAPQLLILEQTASFCCYGCYSIAKMICQQNLTDYYQFRTQTANKAEPEKSDEIEFFDDPEIQNDFLIRDKSESNDDLVLSSDENIKELLLLSENIHCSACAWLIERALNKLKGVKKVRVNVSSQVVVIAWDDTKIALSQIMLALQDVGYNAILYNTENQLKIQDKQNKYWLRRLALAGLGMMQVMMYAVALYLGDNGSSNEGIMSDMTKDHTSFLRWVSFLVATPVLIYSASPIFTNAYTAIKNFKLNMDIPLAIALSLTYMASVLATLQPTVLTQNEIAYKSSTYTTVSEPFFISYGEVYFDSITMLVFFIIVGRYLEFRARMKLASQGNTRKNSPFLLVEKIISYQSKSSSDAEHLMTEKVHFKKIERGDELLIRAGASIPFDGILMSMNAQIDEAMLNGEFMPVEKTKGDRLLGSSINNEQPIILKVSKDFNNGYLQHLKNLQQRCLQQRPDISILADKIARYFVIFILMLALGTFFYWYNHDSAQALWITISVLVITCPCALSLATPVAQTCAITSLNNNQFFVRDKDFLQKLAHVKHIVFDKTGTITHGKLSLNALYNYTPIYNNNEAINQSQSILSDAAIAAIIAALESQSEHPIATAFNQYRNADWSASSLENTAYNGVSGIIKGKYYHFGKKAFIDTHLYNVKNQAIDSLLEKTNDPQSLQYLACEGNLIAAVALNDEVRASAYKACKLLKKRGIALHILSGDPSLQVRKTAQMLDVAHWQKNASPEDKIAYVQNLQSVQGELVLMVGDGVNDAPVMAVADASVAITGAADFTLNSADGYLHSGDLTLLNGAIKQSKMSMKIIKQNLFWALLYNFCVVPFAVMGYIPPYLAAVGMSFSSLLVIMNSLRLNKSFIISGSVSANHQKMAEKIDTNESTVKSF